MKTALALLLATFACLALAQTSRYPMAHIAASNATYELIPEHVALPTGGSQRVITWRRMVTTSIDTNAPTVPGGLTATPRLRPDRRYLMFCYPHDGSASGFRVYTRTSFESPWQLHAELPGTARCLKITNDFTLFRMFTVSATNSAGESPPIAK